MSRIHSHALPVVILLALAGIGGCGGGSGGLEPRFVAVHNALAAMGLAQTGAISEGSLPEGAEARIRQDLTAGDCYTFVALGSDTVADLDVRVLGPDDDEVGRDTTHDRQAAAHLCAEATGEHTVVVRMTSGQGAYTVSSWSGVVSGGRAGTALAGGGRGAPGTCASPLPIEVGRPVHGSTASGQHAMQGSCASGESPEQVYRVEVTERSQLRAVLESAFDGALYLLRTCGQPQTELACNDDQPNTSRSELTTTLEPGTYFLVVDGYGSESGEYDLIVELSGLLSVSAICSDAPPLAQGQPVSGTTAGLPDYFQATCADGARSADRVYRLDVAARSRLRLRQQSDHDGAIYVRRDCADPTTELACNDDHIDNRHALLTTVLDAGRYYVYADGFSSGQAGNFTLTADLTADGGTGATSDACGATSALVPGQQLEPDTFEGRDDYAGSCGGQGSPDVVYELDVRARSRLRVTATESQMDGALYVQRTCGDATTEVACQLVAQGAPAALDTILAAGRYFVVIDGQRPEAFGAMKLDVSLTDVAAFERTCRRAPLIRPGQIINGTTNGQTDDFQATCAGGAASPDTVYRLRLPRRQIVRARLSGDYDCALHIRRDCADTMSELGCNDDADDNRSSFLEMTLDAGTYYVVVDGFQSGNQGNYTLDVQTSNP